MKARLLMRVFDDGLETEELENMAVEYRQAMAADIRVNADHDPPALEVLLEEFDVSEEKFEDLKHGGLKDMGEAFKNAFTSALGAADIGAEVTFEDDDIEKVGVEMDVERVEA